MLSLFSLCSQEMRSAAIARPLEINETEKALRAAIKEVLVCNFHGRLHQHSQGTYLYLSSAVMLTLLLCLCVEEKCG